VSGATTIVDRAGPGCDHRSVDDQRSSGAELLAAVIAEPEDVERRLVYADWLLAQGDPQGELIHLCERKRALQRRDPRLQARIRQLEREHGRRIAGLIGEHAHHYQLDRGFVSTAEMSAIAFASHGEQMLREHPLGRLGLLKYTVREIERLVEAPALPELQGLQLRRGEPMPFTTLCESTPFDSLRNFEVWGWSAIGDPLDAFARWRAPRLRALTLYKVENADRIVAGLARNELVRLRSLCLGLPEAGEGMTAMFDDPAFSQLESLQLLRSRGRTGGLAELLERAELPALRELTIDDAYPVERLDRWRLRKLSLRGPIDARAFERLLASQPDLAQLEITEMAPVEINRSLALALELPSNHTLTYLFLPHEGADPRLLARAKQRFRR